MARILFVGNFSQKIPGGFYYNVDQKLRNGLIRCGHCVLDFSDRDQARLSNIFANRKFGVRGANEKLLQTAQNFCPDWMILGHANIIRNDTLMEIRRQFPAMRITLFNVDSLALDSHMDNVTAIHNRKSAVDTILVTTGGELLRQFKTDKNWVGYFPNPVDAGMETNRNFSHDSLPADMVYCVGGIRDGDPRLDMARFLTNELPDARLEFYGMMGQSNRWGAHYHAVMARARMGLNYSRPNNVPLYASDRMAHIMGNGLLALTANAIGFQKFFTESEMVYYGDNRDLADKIRYYKNNDSAARVIAESGWRKSHREFNGTLVAQYLYERSMGLELSHPYLWADEFIH